MKKAWSSLLLVCFALLVAGCADDQVGGVPRKVAIHTIVSLSPSTSELSSPLQFTDRLKGRTASCNFPAFIKSVPVVAGVKPDYEKIAQISPELVLADKSLYSDADLEKVKATGSQIFIWDPKTVAEMQTKLADLAGVIGVESNASKYADDINEEVHNASARAQGKTTTAALVLPDASGHNMWCGTDSFYADELKSAALTPVGPKSDKYVALDPEEFTKDDPDVIFLAADIEDKAKATALYESFIKDPRMAALKAVKSGNVKMVNQDMALRAGSRVDAFIRRISQAVYGGSK